MKRALGAVVFGCLAWWLAGCGQQPARGPDAVQKLTATPAPTVTPDTAPPAGVASSTTDGSRSAPSLAVRSGGDDRVVARINGEPITMGELMKPLIASHGLQILNALVQLDYLKQEARKDHATITPDDVRAEREATLARLFKDADAREQDLLDAAEAKGDTAATQKLRATIAADREAFLAQYLENQHFSEAEFDLRIEINTYLRKKAERLLAGKITDEMVEKEFGVEYGETADIRYIQLANMKEVAEARQRLKDGKDFGDIAKEMSHDARTAPLKGLLSGISRQSSGLPQTFKDAAFNLQPGEVSDALNLLGFYWIIKLEQKHPPKAVKFDNVKESLRKSMFDRLVIGLIGKLNDSVSRDIVPKLQIEDPTLKAQFDRLAARQQQAAQDQPKQRMQQQLERERDVLNAATQPAGGAPAAAGPSEPATAPTAAPAPAPATQP